MAQEDKGALMLELKERMRKLEPLPGEEGFHLDAQTLMRFLKAREWNVDASERLLKDTVEWRRKVKPLTLDCRWCHERPGYHALRQVGKDELGRPVIYSCFSQAAVHRNTVEDSVTHSTYLIENARRDMPPGVHTWVFVMDCTGMTLPACNPKLGYGCTQVMSNHYPERLGLVICINHSAVFQGVWGAIKVFLHPNTVAKMQLVRGKKKIRDLFDLHFPEELSSWLMDEIRLNKQKPLPASQRHFWRAPAAGQHDPRGSPSYVTNCVDGFPAAERAAPLSAYRPHPNIVDELRGGERSRVGPGAAGPGAAGPGTVYPGTVYPGTVYPGAGAGGSEGSATPGADGDADSSDPEENGAEIEIAEEFQIPKGAASLNM